MKPDATETRDASSAAPHFSPMANRTHNLGMASEPKPPSRFPLLGLVSPIACVVGLWSATTALATHNGVLTALTLACLAVAFVFIKSANRLFDWMRR